MLRMLCASSDWVSAAREAHDMVQRLTIARNRWLLDHDALAGESLNLVVENLQIVGKQTAKFSKQQPSTKDIAAVQRSLGRINERLSAEVGNVERLADATIGAQS